MLHICTLPYPSLPLCKYSVAQPERTCPLKPVSDSSLVSNSSISSNSLSLSIYSGWQQKPSSPPPRHLPKTAIHSDFYPPLMYIWACHSVPSTDLVAENATVKVDKVPSHKIWWQFVPLLHIYNIQASTALITRNFPFTYPFTNIYRVPSTYVTGTSWRMWSSLSSQHLSDLTLGLMLNRSWSADWLNQQIATQHQVQPNNMEQLSFSSFSFISHFFLSLTNSYPLTSPTYFYFYFLFVSKIINMTNVCLQGRSWDPYT